MTQDLVLSSPPQGLGPFLRAPSRVLQCLAEQLALLQPIKLPRLVSMILWDKPYDPLVSMGSPLCKEPFLGGSISSSPMYWGSGGNPLYPRLQVRRYRTRPQRWALQVHPEPSCLPLLLA